MDSGEHTTGTRDEHYDLISVLYHALQGADACDGYALDAEGSGDERLAGFFREAQMMQTQIAERAKALLGIDTAPAHGETEQPPRIEDIRRPSEGEGPPRGDVPPGA